MASGSMTETQTNMKYMMTVTAEIGKDVKIHTCGANTLEDFALLIGKMMVDIQKLEMETRPSVDEMLEHMGKVGLTINLEDLQ